ncbi:hypothetical protein O6H91_07G041800 [Diphasiastrum complanatum]|nr:hypothetical protein O6H91_07G041800 [Diphasiastrum complanatum]KAJ7549136.1 hypothetical protein O6H91_07G041800 [Diphasiastrum complanatum]KAJ7549137.1 hypothetical protein O6H91_07G041800 [Diphasiastrum complanatum]
MEKRRLAARTFGHKRHHVYKNWSVTQPPQESIWYAPEDERLNTDFESLLKTQHQKTQARKKAMIDFQTTKRAYRDYEFLIEREKDWDKMLEREEFFRQKPHARVIANKNSVAYDLINLQYHDGFEGERLKYQDACFKWRENMRAEFLQARMSGNRNYNVISWAKLSPGVHSKKPTTPDLPKVNQIHAGMAK